MVGSQGVEPRCPLGRLIYSQVQSPVLLATHVTKTLATRTGFEPVSSAVTGRRNRPDYANEPNLVDPEGIEPNCQPPYILRQRIYSPP